MTRPPHHPREPGQDQPRPGDTPADPAHLLCQAALVATAEETQRLHQLRQRLARHRLRVLVAGEAKRGKSTLVNALLERDLLPTGILPLTATTTTVTLLADGDVEHATATLRDGRTRRFELDDLPSVVAGRPHTDHHADVDTVTVHLDAPLLRRHPVDLVDTPGTGSIHADNTADAHRALPTMDAAVLVLGADPPVTDAERQLLRTVHELAVHTVVVLNKSDRHSPAELDEVLAFTRSVCAPILGDNARVQPCSARNAPTDPGYAAFHHYLTGYLTSRAASDRHTAARAHTARVLTDMLQHRQLTLRALQATADGRQDRVQELRNRLATVAERRADVADRCAGSLTRLRQHLDSSAASAVEHIASDVRSRFEAQWSEQLGQLDPDAALTQSQHLVDTLITAAVERWRADATTELRHGLAQVTARAEQDITTQANLARAAIRDLLGLTLTDTTQPAQLSAGRGFSYDYTRDPGWQPPLAGLIPRLATTGHRRRRVHAQVAGEIRPLTDRQVGRARSDLQARLQATGRTLRAQVEGAFTHAIDTFTGILDDAAHTAIVTDTQPRRARLADDISHLHELIHELDCLQPSAPAEHSTQATPGAARDTP